MKHWEQAPTMENICILGKEAKNQPRQEVIHLMTACSHSPFRIVFQQFNIEAVEAAGRLNVEGVFFDLANRADSGEFEEKPEVVGKVRVITGDGFAAFHVFRLKLPAIRGQNETGLLLYGRRAVSQGIERGRDFALTAGLYMDISTLQDATHIRLVGRATLQTLNRGRLVAKSFQKGIRERLRLKRLLCQQGYCFFDFYSVHNRVLFTL